MAESLLSLYLAYTAAMAVGLPHGSDPGHGWPVAVLQGLTEGGFKV
ncbi:MAG: hypothetical protein F7B20_05755 [Aeropyrum sp.]|nr:hypothetical protein [Aeropyrum sp.]MCE4616886.1 hypothetical protein [Aeropyrum sp.]